MVTLLNIMIDSDAIDCNHCLISITFYNHYYHHNHHHSIHIITINIIINNPIILLSSSSLPSSLIIILYSRYVHSKILGAFKGIDTREWVDAIDAQQHSQYAIYFELMRSFPNGYKLVTDILGTAAAITVAHDDDW